MANQMKSKTKNMKRKNRRMRRTVMGTLSVVFMLSAIIVALIPTPQSKAAGDLPDTLLISAATADPSRYIPNYTNTSNYPVFANADGKFRIAYGSNGGTMTGIVVYYNQDSQVPGGTLTIPSSTGAYLYDPASNQYVAVTSGKMPLYFESQPRTDEVRDENGTVITPGLNRVLSLCTGENVNTWNGQQLYTMDATPQERYEILSVNSTPMPTPTEGVQLEIPVQYVGSDRYYVDVQRVNRFGQEDGMYHAPEIVNEEGIEMGVFEGSTNFASLTIPQEILAVGNRAFTGCQMTSVTIENGANVIGNHAFENCNQLSALTFAEPSNLKEIGDYAFAGCTYLGAVKIPDQVQKLGNYCFKDCTNLTAININGVNSDGNTSLTTIGNGLFYNCSSLGQVVFPERVSNISQAEFTCYNCQAMTYLGLPGSATGILKANNVKGCNLLDTVKCTSRTLEFECPGNAPHDKNNIPDNCMFGKTNLGYNSAFASDYTVSDAFCILAYKNSEAYNYTQEHNLAFGYLDQGYVGWYEKNVDGCAFCVNENNELVRFEVKDSTQGENVIIPNNIAKYHVSTISAGTFSDNDRIRYLYIPSSVSSIAAGAFEGCTSLRTVQFDNALAVREIGAGAFKTGAQKAEGDMEDDAVTPYTGLRFIGDISSDSVPFQYAMNASNNFNASSAPTQYIAYCSSFPQNLQIQLAVTRDPNTNELLETVPTLVSVPTEDQLKGLESYSLSTYTGTSDYVRTKDEENAIVASANNKQQNNLLHPESPMQMTEEEQEVINAVYHVHVPDGVTAMSDTLFQNNAAVQSVILDTVQRIPERAFEGCSKLDTFILHSSGSESGESIGDHAFYDCDNLEDVVLPASLSEFGSVPFQDCDKLIDVEFDGPGKYDCSDGLICQVDDLGNRVKVEECLVTRGKLIGASKLSASELTGVKEIAPCAFQHCTGIKEAYLDDTEITTVPDYCFDGATDLYYCSLSDSTKKIGKYAFRNTALSTAYVPGSVQSIDDTAFVVGDPGDGNYIQGLTIQCEEDSPAYWYCDDKDGITAETFIKQYTVTFLDYDDYVLKTETVKHGASATAPRVQRPGYTLTGWTEKFDNVKEDITTKAIYEEDNTASIDGYYSVLFQDFDGLYTWDTQYVKEGEYPKTPSVTPSRKGYIFSYWSPSNYQTIAVTGNIVIKAYYTEDPNAEENGNSSGNNGTNGGTSDQIYEVKFVDYDGTLLDSQNVKDGECPVATTVVPSRKGYTFTTWSPSNYASVPVTGNMTVTALYQKGSANQDSTDNSHNVLEDSSKDPLDADNQSNSNTNNTNGNAGGNGTNNSNSSTNGSASNANSVGKGNSSGSISGNSASGTSNRVPQQSNNGTKVEVTKSGISNRDLVTATVSGSNDNFVVKITDSETAKSEVSQALLKEYGSLDDLKFFAMDISLYDSTGTTKIENTSGISVTITMPLPDVLAGYAGNNKAGAVKNGAFEKLGSRLITIDNVPCISFVATHFSPYAIYVETNHLTASDVTDGSPKTGDPIHPKWFLAMGLAMLSILMFLGKGSKNKIVKVIE